MSDIIKKLMTKRSFKARTPATKEQIESAEKTLGLSFSKEYIAYLMEFGCVSVYGHEYTGLCNTSRLNVVHVTITQRNYADNIPYDWYVIEETNIDGVVIWQNSTGEIFMRAPDATLRKLANSLSEYLDQ